MSIKILSAHHRMVALANPCELPEECSARRYFFPAGIGPGLLAYVGLTVNVGEE